VSGESADQVEALSKLLEKDFRRYATAAGGLKFRRVTGVCFSILFLTSLMISSTYYWKNRNRSALGILICSAIGFCFCCSCHRTDLFPASFSISAIPPFFSSGMRVRFFCCAS
jgi:hypothetical protein